MPIIQIRMNHDEKGSILYKFTNPTRRNRHDLNYLNTISLNKTKNTFREVRTSCSAQPRPSKVPSTQSKRRKNKSPILRRLVNDLSKIAQGRQALELGASPNQEKSMRIRGLECLVSILKCMVEWSRDLYVNPSIPAEQQVPAEPPDPPLDAGSTGAPGVGGAGATRPLPRYGSAGSLSSANSSLLGNKEVPDSPEQYEVQKQQKEVWEAGIEM